MTKEVVLARIYSDIAAEQTMTVASFAVPGI